ncbi:MAG: PDZ domain-containing protein [Verrucomicrobiae bacterium]|nr:PDZ domain-containing protein [Verrucomicrobiae bacterium]
MPPGSPSASPCCRRARFLLRRAHLGGLKLFYLKKGKLHFFDWEKEKETEVGDVAGYRVSADQKKMLVRADGDFAIVDLPSGKLDTSDKKLNLADLKVTLDRRAEWNQIYAECWRQMRDFFYAPNLHGVDWPAMRQRYEPLLAHVQHRMDLTYVIGELIGELNAGHAYVGGGDSPKPERIPLGLLGAKLRRDASGYPRIDRILRGHNWDAKYRSPLTEIGVHVRAGDFLIAINGKSTKDMPDPYAALVGTAGRQVKLRVNADPKEEGAREETVIPTADEQPLYYLDWVLGNIETVEKATDGKVGYVHVPDMGVPGLNEFAKFYYPQLHKEALIVDCRGNGGGNVSPMITERLRREPAMWTIARNGAVNVDPSGQVLGPKVLLLDQHSASDGDIVAWRFKTHRLGPVIGQRSWGGVVGIRGTLPLLDGGSLMRPEFSRFSLDGQQWIMEGHGVDPDIEVVNDPAREFAGTDDQLLRAVEEIKKALAANPVVMAPPPPPNPTSQSRMTPIQRSTGSDGEAWRCPPGWRCDAASRQGSRDRRGAGPCGRGHEDVLRDFLRDPGIAGLPERRGEDEVHMPRHQRAKRRLGPFAGIGADEFAIRRGGFHCAPTHCCRRAKPDSPGEETRISRILTEKKGTLSLSIREIRVQFLLPTKAALSAALQMGPQRRNPIFQLVAPSQNSIVAAWHPHPGSAGVPCDQPAGCPHAIAPPRPGSP